MIRIFFVLLTSLLLFTGCSTTTLDVPEQEEIAAPNKKAFEDEDMYVMFALRAEQLKEYNASSSMFNTLYEKSDKKEYLYRSIENDIANKQYDKVIQRVNEITQGQMDDFTLVRFKIVALISIERLDEAKSLALLLVDESDDINDYLLVSDIYVKQKKFDTAVKYLESAYNQNYNEQVLDRMSIILYVNLQRKSDAIAQLETHTRVHGCSLLICSRLVGFYSNENDLDGLLSAYLRLYQIDPNQNIANMIAKIYEYKKDYIKLTTFLEESGSDDEKLLGLYIRAKNFTKAYELADKLYAKTGEVRYLGQSATFEYEGAQDKNDKAMQLRVVDKLERVLQQDQSSLYLNYLGYLLIDHDIDVEKGMGYVRQALEIEPNSAYYLDSLAWGYYKLGKCKKANTIIQKVRKLEGGDDAEVLEHVEKINRCMKGKR